MCAISRAISYAKNSLWCYVRFHVCDIARGWFLVCDSVARWANFSYAILPAREMCLQRACSWPWPCLSKQRMASREQEILLVVLRRRQKVSLNQMKLAVALSCSYVNFIPHNFLSDMVAVDSVHGHASLLWQEPGNPTRGMPWRQGIPGRIPLNTCCRSWKCIFSYAILRSHGNAFSRTRYRALELARDIAHMENGPNTFPRDKYPSRSMHSLALWSMISKTILSSSISSSWDPNSHIDASVQRSTNNWSTDSLSCWSLCQNTWRSRTVFFRGLQYFPSFLRITL